MIIGFTGTSSGLTRPQQNSLRTITQRFHPGIDVVIHGDCIGADNTFDELCLAASIERHAYPGCDKQGNSPKRAWRECEVVRTPAPYLERNHWIVDDCDMLIACPSGPERPRSGTWATVRYARAVKRHVHIIWPDGSVE